MRIEERLLAETSVVVLSRKLIHEKPCFVSKFFFANVLYIHKKIILGRIYTDSVLKNKNAKREFKIILKKFSIAKCLIYSLSALSQLTDDKKHLCSRGEFKSNYAMKIFLFLFSSLFVVVK